MCLHGTCTSMSMHSKNKYTYNDNMKTWLLPYRSSSELHSSHHVYVEPIPLKGVQNSLAVLLSLSKVKPLKSNGFFSMSWLLSVYIAESLDVDDNF